MSSVVVTASPNYLSIILSLHNIIRTFVISEHGCVLLTLMTDRICGVFFVMVCLVWLEAFVLQYCVLM